MQKPVDGYPAWKVAEASIVILAAEDYPQPQEEDALSRLPKQEQTRRDRPNAASVL